MFVKMVAEEDIPKGALGELSTSTGKIRLYRGKRADRTHEDAISNIRLWLGRDSNWVVPESRSFVMSLICICEDAGMSYDKALKVRSGY